MLLIYCGPYSKIEIIIFSLLIKILIINTIIFLICLCIFIFTLKYDLQCIQLNLSILPDLEYFVDLEESTTL
jgi:hypothetical protein